MTTSIERLRDAVHELTVGGLLDLLSELLPPGAGVPQQGGTHQKVSGSPAPWSGPTAGVLMAIHAGARDLEDDLFYRLTGRRSSTQRGGSDTNTYAALLCIVPLAEQLPEAVQKDAAGRVESWVNAARRISAIDEAELWVPLPREPGERPTPCPHCNLYSLRMSKRQGIVRCTTRVCRDKDGRPWTWQLEKLLPKRSEA